MFVTYHDYAYKVIRVSCTPCGIPTITLRPYILAKEGSKKQEVCILKNGNKVMVTPFVFKRQNINKGMANLIVFGSQGIYPVTMSSITTMHKKIHSKYK